MKSHRLFCLSALLVLSGVALAADLKSGPQVEEKIPGPFHPLNINGEEAGRKACLYCANGDAPVAVVFAREVTPAVTKLIKEIDAATVKAKDKGMGSYVVFLGETEGLEGKLKKVVADNKIEKCILCIDNPGGPEKYNIAKAADVTVLLYVDFNVKANFAFKKGELKDADIANVVKALPKILK
jgi:hypothetical protein